MAAPFFQQQCLLFALDGLGHTIDGLRDVESFAVTIISSHGGSCGNLTIHSGGAGAIFRLAAANSAQSHHSDGGNHKFFHDFVVF